LQPGYGTVEYTVTVNVRPYIATFNLTAPVAATGVIDQIAHTITISVPVGTDVTGMITDIGHTGEEITPNSGAAQNFTNPVTYTVSGYGLSQAYVVTVVNPTATVEDVTIRGIVGTLLTPQPTTITLIGATFNAIAANTDVSTWFTPLPPTGVDTKIVSAVTAGATTATITFTGTPTVTSSAPLGINVPAAVLNPSTTLTKPNANAKWGINVVPPNGANFFAYNSIDGGSEDLADAKAEYTLADALTYIANPENDYPYFRLVLEAPETSASKTFNKAGATFRLEADDVANGIITLSSNGYLLRVQNGTLILGANITLEGKVDDATVPNTAALVRVEAGELVMEIGSTIKNNTNSAYGGGGVYVEGSGQFTMNGGTISGNKVTSAGSANGGGVCVNGSGRFTMHGGTISGNTSTGEGGGVSASFSLTNFTKDGGTIYGSTEADVSLRNTAAVTGAAVWHLAHDPVSREETLYPANLW
jgi:hypothetical protein